MVAAVCVGNSKITVGIFEGDALARSFCLSSVVGKTSDEYAVTLKGILEYHSISCSEIDGAVICSVVPRLTAVIAEAVGRLAENINLITVGKGTKTGFPIKIDNPSEMGADLVANAAAVIGITERENKKGVPCIIIDMGAATTVFALNERREYIGGCIIPGVGMSLDALHGKTALLPEVSAEAPIRAIGKNSQDSVRSGVILGNSIMLDGFIDRFSDEMKAVGKTEVFITGEYAEKVIPFCTHRMCYSRELTLEGLYFIYKNNLNTR